MLCGDDRKPEPAGVQTPAADGALFGRARSERRWRNSKARLLSVAIAFGRSGRPISDDRDHPPRQLGTIRHGMPRVSAEPLARSKRVRYESAALILTSRAPKSGAGASGRH